MLKGEVVRVMRSGASPSKIYILEGGIKNAELVLKTDKSTGRLFVTNTNWRVYLGHILFGMPVDIVGSVFEEPFTPTFRALFSYFARRVNSGGFISPERQAEKQQKGDWQTNLSYLFGLDWRIPFEYQKVRARERSLDELRRAAKGGAFGELVGTVAELRPQVTIAETKALKLRQNIENFEVLDSYRELTRRAARTKNDMQALSRDAISRQETLEYLRRTLSSEAPPGASDLRRVYAAAGVELPGIALKRFDEVKRFYESIISNRRSHLEQEIKDVEAEIHAIESRLAVLDSDRREILRTLEGRGALEDFLRLQRELADLEAAAATLRERYKAAEILEGESTQLDLDRANLKRRLQEDHQQRKTALDLAIIIIAEAIQELYEDRAGRFVVDATDNGPEFRISIEGDRGGGVSKVEIFCFDLALFMITSNQGRGPGFLVHDSHLFDGVDERQIAIALSMMQRVTFGKRLQYIVTMNSDIFKRLPFPGNALPKEAVLKTRLSDESESGGLFGFRFN